MAGLEGPSAERVYLAGDGAVVHPLRAELTAVHGEALPIRVETFFNHPARKAAA